VAVPAKQNAGLPVAHLLPRKTCRPWSTIHPTSHRQIASPPIRDEARPKDVKPTLPKSSVDGYLRQIEGLYQDWFFTDEFANREVATIEARLIK